MKQPDKCSMKVTRRNYAQTCHLIEKKFYESTLPSNFSKTSNFANNVTFRTRIEEKQNEDRKLLETKFQR